MRISDWSSDVCSSDLALISWAGWPGYAKGIVLSLLDTLALAILVTSAGPFRKLPLAGIFLFYLFAALLSVALSTLPMSSAFYLFQLMRVFLFFAAVASFAGQPGAVRWLCLGLALGATFQAVMTVDQRSDEHTSELQSLMRTPYVVF